MLRRSTTCPSRPWRYLFCGRVSLRGCTAACLYAMPRSCRSLLPRPAWQLLLQFVSPAQRSGHISPFASAFPKIFSDRDTFRPALDFYTPSLPADNPAS